MTGTPSLQNSITPARICYTSLISAVALTTALTTMAIDPSGKVYLTDLRFLADFPTKMPFFLTSAVR